MKSFNFFGSYSSDFQPFIVQVNSGASGEITIPTNTLTYTYDYDVFVQETSQSFTNQTGDLTITFPATDTNYTIEISGLFPHIQINNNSEKDKFLDIVQWGDVVMGSNQSYSYYYVSNLTCTATDSPDMTLVTYGRSMFLQATSFNPPNFAPTLENLTNGDYMFRQATSFNPPNFAPTLENLTSGLHMFYLATSFNPPNFAPTLENLTNGGYMFFQATSFNPPNFAPTLENLTNGRSMFYLATDFSQEINCPNTTQLTNDSFMFTGTKIPKITMNNTVLTTTDAQSYNCPLLTDLILIDRKVDLRISYSPLLLGAKIDALFTSLGTANSGATITLTTAQNTSGIDTTIATNKGWTIVII